NHWQETSLKLTNQEISGAAFQTNLSNRLNELISMSNRWVKARGSLEKSEAAASAALKESQSRAQRISELETERAELARAMEELKTSLHSQQVELAETSKKLQKSDNDRSWLVNELKQLQATQDRLAEAFNDPRSVREQLDRLRKEESDPQPQLNLVKREPGSERPIMVPKSKLKLQLQQDGSVKLVPPVNNASARP